VHLCRLSDWDIETASFFADLFCHVAHVGEYALAGHDLYHGHVFAGAAGVGLLLHAKEHPREYTASCTAIHTIGDARAGGPNGDARMGTTTSVFDSDYHMRNVVWLAGQNRCFVLNPRAQEFPHEALSFGSPDATPVGG
jgi:hypothetical protein